jgi:hypothetical protein
MRDFEKTSPIPKASIEQVNANMLKVAALSQTNVKRSVQPNKKSRGWLDSIVDNTPIAFAAKIGTSFVYARF